MLQWKDVYIGFAPIYQWRVWTGVGARSCADPSRCALAKISKFARLSTCKLFGISFYWGKKHTSTSWRVTHTYVEASQLERMKSQCHFWLCLSAIEILEKCCQYYRARWRRREREREIEKRLSCVFHSIRKQLSDWCSVETLETMAASSTSYPAYPPQSTSALLQIRVSCERTMHGCSGNRTERRPCGRSDIRGMNDRRIKLKQNSTRNHTHVSRAGINVRHQ